MAGYKNWVDLTPLTESDLDDFVGKQVLMKFATSATRDAALTLATGKREGMATIQDDSNSITVSTGTGVGNYSTIGPVHGALTSWTPTADQGAGLTLTNAGSAYTRLGRLVIANFIVTATSAGTASQPIRVSLPVAAANANFDYYVMGTAQVYDLSATTRYEGNAILATSGLAKFGISGAGTAGFIGGSGPTIASGDILSGQFIYEAAADA